MRVIVWLSLAAVGVRADEFIHAYEGDVLPYPDAGWWDGNCEQGCRPTIDNGHLALTWTGFWIVNYGFVIATPQTPPPPSPPFWIEWSFRSTDILDGQAGCDGRFSVQYQGFFDWIGMFSDAVVSSDGGTVLSGLHPGEFRTYRFETADGMGGSYFVSGERFISETGTGGSGYSIVQMQGLGGCDGIIPTVNEWDYVRYGRITYGEQIIASDPPGGFVDARAHAPLDRFTVTFDEPNYVLVDEVTIKVEGIEGSRDQGIKVQRSRDRQGAEGSFRIQNSAFDPGAPGSSPRSDIPAVVATRRRDNGPPDEVEIVLNQPIPYDATTRFTFDDGVAVNIVEFTFASGDVNGDGRADLFDFAYLQNCFGPTSPCPLLGMEGGLESPLSEEETSPDPLLGKEGSGPHPDPLARNEGTGPHPNPLPRGEGEKTCGPCLVLDLSPDPSGIIDAADYAAFLALITQ